MQPLTTLKLLFAAAITMFALSACGGGGGDGGGSISPASGSPSKLRSRTAAEITTMLNQAGAAGQQLVDFGGTPQCGVDFYRFTYSTKGALGESTSASAALLVPTGNAAACVGPRPMVLYAHGTELLRHANIADATNPSLELLQQVAIYASQGYVVIAPNYAGYDTSTLPYHPYHNADQQSQDMTDALDAGRAAMASLSTPVASNGKLFLTGYSQGGHVAIATHREMQSRNLSVTASAGQSGAYALITIVDKAIGGEPPNNGNIYFPMLITSFQKAYGDIYSVPSDIYTANFAAGVETLLPTNLSLSALFNSPTFPEFVFGNDVPNFGSVAPAFQPFYGPPAQSLIKSAYVAQLLNDIATHPCSSNLAAPLACAPANKLRAAAVKNDLRNWTPVAPMLLCGGHADPDVFFVSAQQTKSYFDSMGANVSLLDVDSAVMPNETYASAKNAFLAAKASVTADAMANGQDVNDAIFQSYHSDLVSAGCAVAARDFFNTF